MKPWLLRSICCFVTVQTSIVRGHSRILIAALSPNLAAECLAFLVVGLSKQKPNSCHKPSVLIVPKASNLSNSYASTEDPKHPETVWPLHLAPDDQANLTGAL